MGLTGHEMDNTANIFSEVIKYLTPVVSVIVLLLSYIWNRQVTDFREWLNTHNKEIDDLKTYVIHEIKEINIQSRDREINRHDELQTMYRDIKKLEGNFENFKVICDIRHNK